MNLPPIRALALLAFVVLAACSGTTGTQKRRANAEPVKAVAIVVLMGTLLSNTKATPSESLAYGTTFRDALQKRLPAIFEANGVPVRYILVQPVVRKSAARPDALLAHTGISHGLVLNANGYTNVTRPGAMEPVGAVLFEAELWDAKTKGIVWKAGPSLGVVDKQPLLQTQQFAAQVLNAMHGDDFVELKRGHAVDLSGERISDYPVDAPDR